jgi:hypothetical protein
MTDIPAETEWRPTSELRPTDTMYVNVRVTTVTTYRWKPYKPDGARQMGVKGRWQRAREYDGWENAKLPPDGEWVPN